MPRTKLRQKMAPGTGGLFVRVQVWPPSFEVAAPAELFAAKSPPPTMPFQGSRKATEIPPALGELTSGVSYAFQVSPPSLVAKILAIVEPPVAIQAFLPPCVATQVPLAAKEASPGSAGGILAAMDCQVISSVVRISGNTPFTESLCATPRLGVQNARQS